jgi:ketosteroid isomerase-like protein
VSQQSLDLIDRFYAALDRHDGETMAACYTPDATFTDPVFEDLSGAEPGAMWRMLTNRAGDLTVKVLERAADATGGQAHWVARYTFGQTGRRVVNDVRSTFRFRDRLIADQRDEFDLTVWGRQALGGLAGRLAWSSPVQKGIRRRARAGLDQFLARQG